MALLCTSASATQQVLFTDWYINEGYIGALDIVNSTPSDIWKFTLPNADSGITYKLYFIDDGVVKAQNVSQESLILSSSNLSDGSYYILKIKPNILVTEFDPSNISCNSEFVLYNSTVATNISYVQENVTEGVTYRIYDPNTLVVYGSAVATDTNATINVTGLLDGTYRVDEIGSQRLLFSYWNTSNTTCIGIVELYNSTPATVWQFNISTQTSSKVLKMRNVDTGDTFMATLASGAYSISGMTDGIYQMSLTNSGFAPIIGGFAVATFVIISFAYLWRRRW